MDMNYVDSFDLFGTKARQKACKPGTGAPTKTTEGAVGDLYMDTTNGDIYKCTAVKDDVYTWDIFSSDSKLYYTDLTGALTDIKNGKVTGATSDSTNAVVMLDFVAKNPSLTLLQDIDRETQIEISTNMNLILNGHTLNMSYAGDNITVVAGATLSIDGTKDGSAVLVNVNSEAATLARVHGTMNIKGGQYNVTGGVGNTAAFAATDTSPGLSLRECSILVENSTSGTAVCVQSQATTFEIDDVEIVTNGYRSTPVQFLGEANISKLNIKATASDVCNGIIAFSSSKSTATITDSKIDCSSPNGSALALQIQASATLYGKNLQISAVTHADPEVNVSARGIFNSGICTVEDTVILADSKYGHADGAHSLGINNSPTGTLTCHNIQSAATLAGLQNNGNLYASRCLLSGVTHGGLYELADHDKEAVVNDTVLEAGVYRGQFTDIYADLFGPTTNPGSINAYAAMYFGDSDAADDGGDLYMDSCIFVGLCNEAFVVRAAAYTSSGLADGKHPNRLFISRSKIAAQKTNAEKGQIPSIRLNRGADAVYTAAFAELYIGTGCNFTVDNVQLSQDVAPYVHSDDVLYREKDQHLPTFEEYYALVASQGQGGNVSSLNEVSAALDHIIALQEELIGV